MPHRPGHFEDSGEGIYSMDRRKYLSTLAAGAAFGTVAVGLAACSPGGGDKSTIAETAPDSAAIDSLSGDHHDIMGLSLPGITGQNLWGYLRVFPPEITRVMDAKTDQLVGVKTIRIPFLNNTGLDLSISPIIGFTLLTIGCPAKFVLAINLTRDDHPPIEQPPLAQIIQRHKDMDAALVKMGYVAEDWNGIETTPCPPPR